MKRASTIGMVLFGLILGVVLTACGGGGGGGDSSSGTESISYSGLTSQASIADVNSEDITTGAYEGGSSGSSMWFGNSVQNLESPNGQTGYLVLAQAVEKSVRRLDASSTGQAGDSRAIITVYEEIIGDCPGSPGDAAGTFYVNDQNGNFTAVLVFNDYCTQGKTIRGTAYISGNVNETGDMQLAATYSSITVTLAWGGSVTESGGFTCTVVGPTTTVTINEFLRNNLTSKVFWVEDYVVVRTEYSTYADEIMSGRFYHPDYGYVAVTTSLPVRHYYDSDYADQGVIIITGSAGTKAKLTLNDAQYLVEADTDGDGLYDDYYVARCWDECG